MLGVNVMEKNNHVEKQVIYVTNQAYEELESLTMVLNEKETEFENNKEH